jgi:hypothetical protein
LRNLVSIGFQVFVSSFLVGGKKKILHAKTQTNQAEGQGQRWVPEGEEADIIVTGFQTLAQRRNRGSSTSPSRARTGGAQRGRRSFDMAPVALTPTRDRGGETEVEGKIRDLMMVNENTTAKCIKGKMGCMKFKGREKRH